MPLDEAAQQSAVDRLQRRVWAAGRDRFQERQTVVGLTQADLARRLDVSRPQIHVWLTDPGKITLKAAARLMLAMDDELDVGLAGR